MIYTILTTLIIILSKIRDKTLGGPHKRGYLRTDRTIPWCNEFTNDVLFMGCCDCGMGHLIIAGHSVTPIRPRFYRYLWRFGAKAWTEPDLELGEEAFKKAVELEIAEQ